MSPPSHGGSLSKSSKSWVPPRELISPASGWQVVTSPSTIVTFTSCHESCVLDALIMHTGRVSNLTSQHTHGIQQRDKADQHPRTNERNGSYIYGFSFSYICSTPTRALWFLKIFQFLLNWLFLLYSIAQLRKPTTLIPYPPPLVISFPSESMAESTGAPFAVTYGEQGRQCERVALSGAVT